jgi:WD40 repeat protein
VSRLTVLHGGGLACVTNPFAAIALVLLVGATLRARATARFQPEPPAKQARPTEPRRLSKADVVYLLGDHQNPILVEEVIRLLGVDFVLTPADVKDLERAGAAPQLLELLRKVAPAASSGPAIVSHGVARPLSENDIIYLLRNDVPSRRVEIIGSQLGIDFQLTLTVEDRLRHAGATSDLLRGLQRAEPSTLVVHMNPAGAAVFIDGSSVANGSSGSTVQLARLTPGLHRLGLSLPGHLAYEQDVELSPGGATEVTVNLAPLPPPHLGVPLAPVETSLTSVARSQPSGDLRPAASFSPDIKTGPASPPRSNRFPDFLLARTLTGHENWVTAVAFSADGRLLASGSWDKTIKLWDVTTGREVKSLPPQPTGIEAIAFSPNGRWLASERSDNSVALIDAATGKEIRTLTSRKGSDPLNKNWDYSLAFSPDGRWLASGTDGNTVGVWDVGTGREVRELSGHQREVIYVAFSRDGRWLATGDDGETVDLWDATTGEKVRSLAGHTKDVYAVAFSPDSRWLASASGDKTVKLWDVATGHELRTFRGHTNRVTSVVFSPDGRYLASGGWDKTVRLWDVATGRELETLTGHARPVYAIAFSPNGRWLASGSEDKTLKVWSVGSSTTVAQSESP